MKDITLSSPDVHTRRLNTNIIASWLRGVRFLKKKKSKHEGFAVDEPTYDVDEIRRSEYPVLEGSYTSGYRSITA